jgi:hypothetical protein
MNGHAIPEQVYALIEEYNVLRRVCHVAGGAIPGANFPLRPSDIQWLEGRLATIRSVLSNMGYVRFIEGN